MRGTGLDSVRLTDTTSTSTSLRGLLHVEVMESGNLCSVSVNRDLFQQTFTEPNKKAKLKLLFSHAIFQFLAKEKKTKEHHPSGHRNQKLKNKLMHLKLYNQMWLLQIKPVDKTFLNTSEDGTNSSYDRSIPDFITIEWYTTGVTFKIKVLYHHFWNYKILTEGFTMRNSTEWLLLMGQPTVVNPWENLT